eukprot:scaffold2753_cov115-Isochrysis_galbana.AAC.5
MTFLGPLVNLGERLPRVGQAQLVCMHCTYAAGLHGSPRGQRRSSRRRARRGTCGGTHAPMKARPIETQWPRQSARRQPCGHASRRIRRPHLQASAPAGRPASERPMAATPACWAPESRAQSVVFTCTPLASARVMPPGVSRTTLNGAPPPHNSYISGDQQHASRSKTTSALVD